MIDNKQALRAQINALTEGRYEMSRDYVLQVNDQNEPRHTLTPHEVLDMHVRLHRQMAEMDNWMVRNMTQYAVNEIAANPAWGASHFHPATHVNDMGPWLETLGTDLFGAVTYQVTAEMIDLAGALRAGQMNLADVRAEDLPSTSGFMWLDKAIPRPSVEDTKDQEPLKMHAVSWQLVPSFPMNVAMDDGSVIVISGPGLRLREWGYCDNPDTRPTPLHLMGQTMVPLNEGIHSPLPEIWMVHMLWILMQMKITTSVTELPTRHGAKRAKNLKHKLITVVKLRRTERAGESKPSATPAHIDWTCTWLVRGHNRKAPHGGTFADGRTETWVNPYIKGPDGLPLRTTDILYKLAR